MGFIALSLLENIRFLKLGTYFIFITTCFHTFKLFQRKLFNLKVISRNFKKQNLQKICLDFKQIFQNFKIILQCISFRSEFQI